MIRKFSVVKLEAQEVPSIQPRRTREDMADFFATMNANFVPEDGSAPVSAFLVDGEDAVVMGRVSLRARVQNAII